MKNEKLYSIIMIIMLSFTSFVQPLVGYANPIEPIEGEVNELELHEEGVVIENDEVMEVSGEKEIQEVDEDEFKDKEVKEPVKNKGDPVKRDEVKEKETQAVKEKRNTDKSFRNKEERKKEEALIKEDSDVYDKNDYLLEFEGGIYQGYPASQMAMARSFSSKSVPSKKPTKIGNKVFHHLNQGNINMGNGIFSIGYVLRKNNLITTTHIKRDETGSYAYCLNFDLASPSTKGTEYVKSENEKLTDLEYSVIYYGHGGEGDVLKHWDIYSGDKAKKRYYITQIALYAVSNDLNSANYSVKDLKADTRNIYPQNYSVKESKDIYDNVIKFINYVKKNKKTVPKEETLDLSFSGGKPNFKYDIETDTLKTQDLRLDVSNKKAKLNVKGDLGKAKVIQGGKEVELKEIVNGKDFYLEVPYSEVDKVKDIEIKVSGEVSYTNFSKYVPKKSEGKSSDGRNYQRIAWIGEDVSEDSAKITGKYEKVLGEVEVKKIDEEKNTLSGVEFTLFDKNGKEVKKGVTNSKGIASFKNLELGKYVLKETRGKEGYLTNLNKEIDVGLENENKLSFTVENKRITGDLKILKVDKDTGKPLSGAEFAIIDINNEVVDVIKTDKEGFAEINLPYGKYKVTEIKAPNNYILSDISKEFEIQEMDQLISFTFDNKVVNGDVELIKKDNVSSEFLEGVKFEVTTVDGKPAKDVKGNEIGVLTTNEKGYLSVNLPYGEYTIKEVETIEGYVLGNFEESFEITEDKTKFFYEVENRLIEGSLEIIKKEAGSDKLLSGAEFEVLDSEGEVIDVIVTDEDGIATIDGLVYGNYSFREIKAPEGYVFESDEIDFVIDTDGQVSKHEIFNDLITGNLKILKVDKDTGKPLSGAEFKVVNGNGELVDVIKTDKEGFAEINLPYGKYKVTEIKAPNNYILSDISEEFEIKEMDQLISFTFDNKIVNGDVGLIKKDNVTGEFLEGVKFEVVTSAGEPAKDVKGNEIGILKTDEKGYLSVNLPYGEYTIKEVETIEGYVLGNFEESFEITEDKTKFFYEVENRLIEGSLEITKKETGSDKLLSGAEFEVLDSEGEVIDVIVTDEDGIATIDGLVYGNYSFREIKAPEGYVFEKDEIAFVIDTDGQISKHEIFNNRVEGKVVPETATRMFNYLLVGFGLMLLSSLGYYLFRKKKEGEQEG